MAAKKTTTKKKSNKKNVLTFNVTQKHIDNGIPGDSEGCAIALSVKETFAALGLRIINTEDIEIDGEIIIVSFKRILPKTAKAFITKFDKDEPEPSSFRTEKYEDGRKNPDYKKAKKEWDNRVKPFSFSV